LKVVQRLGVTRARELNAKNVVNFTKT
jgi:hypothetical protein